MLMKKILLVFLTIPGYAFSMSAESPQKSCKELLNKTEKNNKFEVGLQK